ncbi:hypothetical protein CLF_100512 [Clonorchis sinensis]|uniref:Uncharacterized protein n=1 Tax=Clonorchis sinensis TaxID=79923 RepID=G7Y3M8_CLOSI|nr:hypothetical protein CLF_100512 [Clonorchis sinensis]
MPPSVPFNHYFGSENQQNIIEILFHCSRQEFSGTRACFEHSNLFKVNVRPGHPVKGTWKHVNRSAHPPEPSEATNHANTCRNRHGRKAAQPRHRLTNPSRCEPGQEYEQRHVAMRPRSNYELFNCNNFNIRFWSWSYRGCWHQTKSLTLYNIFSA